MRFVTQAVSRFAVLFVPPATRCGQRDKRGLRLSAPLQPPLRNPECGCGKTERARPRRGHPTPLRPLAATGAVARHRLPVAALAAAINAAPAMPQVPEPVPSAAASAAPPTTEAHAPEVSQTAAPQLSTFSIVACDTVGGFLGVAIQSRVVSAGSIVSAAEAGVGAIATQAAANVAFKRRGLELLRQGRTAEEVAAEFKASDPGIAHRQFAIVDAKCRTAAYTGDSTIAWAGHRVGRHYSVQGNILAGPQVVDAMAKAYEEAEAAGLPFGQRLLAALKAGQDAGGDRRGRQGAGLLIVKERGGYAGGDDRYADLRVEDHVEPILELERVYGVWMSVFHPEDYYLPNGTQPFSAPAGPHVCALRNLLAQAGFGTPAPQERSQCTFDEEVIAALKAFQRSQGLPERAAVTREVVERLNAKGRSR